MQKRFRNGVCARSQQFSRKIVACFVLLFVGPGFSTTLAYEVWMGTHRMSSELATEPTSWSRTAAWVDGVNFNIAPSGTNPATLDQRKEVLRRLNHINHTIVGVPRAAVGTTNVDEASRADIANRISSLVNTARRDGARLNEFMLYDERTNGVLHTWTETELGIYREEMDKQGLQSAKLIWRATNNARRNLDFASLPIVDGLLIEGSADRFINNRFNVNTLAQSFWNRSANANKELYLQIPRSENSDSQYQATREAVLEMQNVIGIEGVRSDRLVIVPVTYNDTPLQLPETINNGTAYPNTMPGIQLSLIEQRPYFEGRMGELPANFAASTARIPMAASIASETDGSLRRNKSTGAVDGASLGFVKNSVNLDVGQTGSAPYDRAAVMPFQLPNFGDVNNPFLSAHFEGFLTETVTDEDSTAALYGLDRRSAPDILDSDYYGLTNNVDPDATLLQDDFLTWDMDENAPFFSTAVGNEALLEFLNEQYAGGEGAGDYVFLRVSSNANNTQNWVFGSGNSLDEFRRPQLRYISAAALVVVPEPASLGSLLLATGAMLLCRRRRQSNALHCTNQSEKIRAS
jgi:hypothetical protein